MSANQPISAQEALDQLHREADPAYAAEAAAYHKAARPYLGIRVPRLTELAKTWRDGLAPEARIALADGLWRSDIHEARVAAAKLLVQARIRPDEEVWRLITSWVPEFDAWSIADHVAEAGARRLIADPSRLDEVEEWTRAPNMWQRRAALVFTLPWAKMNNLKPAETEARERILSWAGACVQDRDWFIQKAVGGWLRDLSKHDAARAEAFLDGPGAGLKSFARKLARTWTDGTVPAKD